MGCGVFQTSSEVNCVLLWDFEHGVSHFIWFMAIVNHVMLKRNEAQHFRDITGSCPKFKNKVKTHSVGPNSQSYSDHWACRYRIAVPLRSIWQGVSLLYLRMGTNYIHETQYFYCFKQKVMDNVQDINYSKKFVCPYAHTVTQWECRWVTEV